MKNLQKTVSIKGKLHLISWFGKKGEQVAEIWFNVRLTHRGESNYPYDLAQDAAYQSHTGHLTGLWFLPKLAQGPNSNNNNNNNS
jgi:hypothetical protein